jgi:RNA polymerase sigma-70 factor (ECF subfamily)
MPDAALFEAHRKYLIGVAYRMLGTLADAEDVVQDAFLRWHGAATSAANAGDSSLENPRGYFTRIVTRLCLDRLKSAQARREIYVGPWLPEPIIGAGLERVDPRHEAELADDISYALMLTLERLSPLERTAFLLHDVLDVEFDEIAEMLERSSDSCRQLAARARTHIRGGRTRYDVSVAARAKLADAFVTAARSGDAREVAKILADDVVFLSDGGGRVPAAINPIQGRDPVSRMIAGLGQRWLATPEITFELVAINGLPGAIFYHGGEVMQTVALETNESGAIAAIYTVRNPEKLVRVPKAGSGAA